MTFMHSDAISQTLHSMVSTQRNIIVDSNYLCIRLLLSLWKIDLSLKIASNRFRCVQICMKMRISAKDGKRAPACKISRGHRQGNALSYEGNICKQVIDALEWRLDKWRTVPLLFKRPGTCEWIFCSQKARRAPQDFHSRPSRPLRALLPSITKARTKEYAKSCSYLDNHTIPISIVLSHAFELNQKKRIIYDCFLLISVLKKN